MRPNNPENNDANTSILMRRWSGTNWGLLKIWAWRVLRCEIWEMTEMGDGLEQFLQLSSGPPPGCTLYLTGPDRLLAAPSFLDNHSWARSQNGGLVGLVWTYRWGLLGWHKNFSTGYNRVKSFINRLSKLITQSQSKVKSDGFNTICQKKLRSDTKVSKICEQSLKLNNL